MKRIVLNPGDLFFGSHGQEVRTLLGSCVAITLWHPQRGLGGMCHYLLPQSDKQAGDKLDGRYGDQAMALFLKHIKSSKTKPQDYDVKIFGGGNMFPESTSRSIVGDRNIEAAHNMLRQHGFRKPEAHVGCSGHRTVILDLATGETWLRWQKGKIG